MAQVVDDHTDQLQKAAAPAGCRFGCVGHTGEMRSPCIPQHLRLGVVVCHTVFCNAAVPLEGFFQGYQACGPAALEQAELALPLSLHPKTT